MQCECYVTSCYCLGNTDKKCLYNFSINIIFPLNIFYQLLVESIGETYRYRNPCICVYVFCHC